MTGDAATTVSAVSRCLTGALAAKPHSPAAPASPSLHQALTQPLQVQSVPSLRCITAGRLACARPHRLTGCLLQALAAGAS